MTAPAIGNIVSWSANGVSQTTSPSSLTTQADDLIGVAIAEAEQGSVVIEDNANNHTGGSGGSTLWQRIGITGTNSPAGVFQNGRANSSIYIVPKNVALTRSGHTVTVKFNSTPNFGAAYPGSISFFRIPGGVFDRIEEFLITASSDTITAGGVLANADELFIVLASSQYGGADMDYRVSGGFTQHHEQPDGNTYWTGALFSLQRTGNTANPSYTYSTHSTPGGSAVVTDNAVLFATFYYDPVASGTTVAAPLTTSSYSPRTPQVKARVAGPRVLHTYTAQLPKVSTRVAPNRVLHTYTAQSPKVQARVASPRVLHTYTGRVPGVLSGVAVQIPLRTHSYTSQTPSVRTMVRGVVVSHTYTARTPQTKAMVRGVIAVTTYFMRVPQLRSMIRPTLVTMTYTMRIPTFLTGSAIGVPVVSHSYTSRVPQAKSKVAVPRPVITYTAYPPSTAAQIQVAVPVRSHTYTPQLAQVKSMIRPSPVIHTYSGRIPVTNARLNLAIPRVSHVYTAQSVQARSSIRATIADHTYFARIPGLRRAVAVPRVNHTYSGLVPLPGGWFFDYNAVERVLSILAENRQVDIDPENREVGIDLENRTYTVK